MTRSDDESTLRLSPVEGFLFDMDGTIVTSIASVERAWTSWADRIGVLPAAVLAYMHGRRAVDTITFFSPPGTDIAAEARWLDDREHEDMAHVAQVPGAGPFLNGLHPGRWAVVTSANRPLALARIAAAGLPVPPLLVCSDDVSAGKPDPEGYLSAARMLGINPRACVVFEDVPAGIAAGHASGAQVIQVSGTQGATSPLAVARINDYRQVTLADHGTVYSLAIRASTAS